MEFIPSSEFDKVLHVNGKITIIYIKDDKKNVVKSIIKKITDHHLILETTTKVTIPPEQTLSVIYTSAHGLCGFHSHSSNINKHGHENNLLSLEKPESGAWRLQRRKFPRMEIFKDSYFIKENQRKHNSCFLYNIGQGGIGLQTNEALSIGEQINISIEIDDLKTKEACTIVWGANIPEEEKIDSQYQYIYGAKFDNVSSLTRDFIRKLEKNLHKKE